ncbi:Na+/H+ antiporter NhaC family protein [Streptomyces sp. NPDC057582]|uniref:Na+/H+ antiporter NhaC family protein n=1 Tax=Streptomyces sp. NPDC057582 TaxID=3346174 RepID=UPI0036ACAE5C
MADHKQAEPERLIRPASLADAIVPPVVLAVLVAGSLALFGLEALDGPVQVALIMCAMAAALIALKNGHSWAAVQQAAQSALTSITSAVFILLAVGALIGVWNLSGTIPTLVYYGIQILSPSWYYAATALICGAVAMSSIAQIDDLLSRGGMDSMLLTLWLIIGAVTFGAVLEEFGLITRLVDPLARSARSTGRLFFTVFACAFGLNIVAGDQYIALVLPSRVFRLEFARRGLAATNLSRLAADSGTVTSALVPWNSCGAFMGAVLGVPTLSYLPHAVFNYASPALSVLYGMTGFKIEKTAPVAADTEPDAQ